MGINKKESIITSKKSNMNITLMDKQITLFRGVRGLEEITPNLMLWPFQRKTYWKFLVEI